MLHYCSHSLFVCATVALQHALLSCEVIAASRMILCAHAMPQQAAAALCPVSSQHW